MADWYRRPGNRERVLARVKTKRVVDGEALRESDRRRFQRDKEKRQAKAAEWAAANPEQSNALKVRWKKRNPEKIKAHGLLKWAIHEGQVTKQACEVCGSPKSEGHHDDYAKPLEVRWLCRRHHAEWHRLLNEEKRR
jgi:hypothetical protein